MWPELFDVFRWVQMIAGLITVAAVGMAWTRPLALGPRIRLILLACFATCLGMVGFERLHLYPDIVWYPLVGALLNIAAASSALSFFAEPRMEPSPKDLGWLMRHEVFGHVHFSQKDRDQDDA